MPSLARLLVRAGLAAVVCCSWLGLLEGAVTRVRFSLGIGEVAWLIAATAVLGLGFVLPAAVVVATVLRVGLLRRGFRWIGRHRRTRWSLVVAAAAVSVALHWINATAYVRLYLTIHLLLSVVSVAMVLVVAFVAVGEPAFLAHPPRRSRRAIVFGAVVAWVVAVFAVLSGTLGSHRLRSVAVDQSTLLSHELIVLDSVTGLLAVDDEIAADVPEELLATFEAQPLTSPRGLARGANVVLLTVDSLRADRMTATGAQQATLPRLEALSDQSVRFSRAQAPSCWTIHSMTAVLRGRLPSQLEFTPVSVSPDLSFTPRSEAQLLENPLLRKKITPVPLNDPAPDLARILRDAGYQTATVVPYVFYLPAAGVTRSFEWIDDRSYRGLPIDGSGITAVPMVDRAIAFLNERDTAKPFFLWLHFMEPHAPYDARDDGAKGANAMARYDSELRYVDREIGRLVDVLQERGLLDGSIVIVHADHGEEFRDHGGQFHASTLYDEVVRVPFFVRLPVPLRGRPLPTIHAPVSLVDIMPTVADLVGVAVETPITGRSLVPALLGEAARARPVIAECQRFGRDKRALILYPYKLIADRVVGTVELYRIDSDPREQRNIADDEPDTTRELRALLRAAEQRGLPGPPAATDR